MAAVLAAALRRSAACSFSGLVVEAVGPEAGPSGPRSTRTTGGPATGRSPTRPYSSTRPGLSSSRPSPCPKKIGEKYGVEYSEEEILRRYRWAYEQPWGQSRLRYENDGRPFWQFIVSSSTGCSDPQYFEELYNYYTTDKAWHLCDPEAEKVFKALRRAGVKLGVVSSFASFAV